MEKSTPCGTIRGHAVFPEQWTVFGPVDGADVSVPEDALRVVSATLAIGGQTLEARRIDPTRNQFDFKPCYGATPYTKARSTFVFVPVMSETEQLVTLGVGADWFYRIYVNGEIVLDLMTEGNGGRGILAMNNHCVDVQLRAGDNLVVVHLVNGKNGCFLALGGPEELRRGDFTSILPPRDTELNITQLAERYPADPEAPLRWVVPDGFAPWQPGLGLPTLEAAEHFELLHCRKSKAPLDEGGTGVYESLEHGTWNHNVYPLLQFQDRLIGVWDNHALDENGPGSRVLARVGKILDDEGHVDWTRPGSLVEAAPAPVPVRRRTKVSDSTAVRGAQARGTFYLIGDRLFFCGDLSAMYGFSTSPQRRTARNQVIPPEHFFFTKGASNANASETRWDFGFRFFQEWALRDDCLQPVSPLYKENHLPEKLQITPALALPLEPLVAPYADAPLLSTAPDDFRELVLHGKRIGLDRVPQKEPGTEREAADGHNGIVPSHGSQFRRPDGGWTAIMENLISHAGPFYYASERQDADPCFPHPRRSNLFGGVKPAAGELPGGGNYIVCNSPNRQNMFITLSSDGRLFDRTWHLLHRRLADFTPGAMKNQGGPGSGPQYYKAAVVGRSLWIIYSICKEHMGATRIPVDVL